MNTRFTRAISIAIVLIAQAEAAYAHRAGEVLNTWNGSRFVVAEEYILGVGARTDTRTGLTWGRLQSGSWVQSSRYLLERGRAEELGPTERGAIEHCRLTRGFLPRVREWAVLATAMGAQIRETALAGHSIRERAVRQEVREQSHERFTPVLSYSGDSDTVTVAFYYNAAEYSPETQVVPDLEARYWSSSVDPVDPHRVYVFNGTTGRISSESRVQADYGTPRFAMRCLF